MSRLKTKIGMYPGKASIGYQGITIVKVAFVVSVTRYDHREYIDRSDKPIYPRTAFASYASENREEALFLIQGMRKIAPDLEIFVDVFSLRSGQNWQDKLKEHVPKKEHILPVLVPGGGPFRVGGKRVETSPETGEG